jgi:hypothetical protein
MEPLRSTPVTGWRAWNLSGGDTPLLHPVAADGDPWPAREAFEARCESPSLLRRWRPHEAPHPRCRCGIYAARSPDDFDRPRPAWPPAAVVGTVSLWGRVIEHERGWRARVAYPARVRLVCVMCAWFEPGPGHPVVVHSFGRRVYPLCELHGDGIELPDGRTSIPTDGSPPELQARLLSAYAVDPLPVEAVEPLFRLPRTPEPPAYWPSIRVARRRSRG